MTNRHFGRVTEVWKHLVLAEVLAAERPDAVLDTHAGDALYPVVDDPERLYGVLTFNGVMDEDAILRGSAYAAVLSAEGMDSVYAALATRDAASVAVFIDPFDHHAAGSSGLSAVDLAVEAARAGASLIYWYGYNKIDRRHWIVDELTQWDAARNWWCGDLMVSAEDADMTAGDLGVASSPGTGSGLVCCNASVATIERCTALGTALEAAYRNRALPSGRTGTLDFQALQRS